MYQTPEIRGGWSPGVDGLRRVVPTIEWERIGGGGHVIATYLSSSWVTCWQLCYDEPGTRLKISDGLNLSVLKFSVDWVGILI